MSKKRTPWFPPESKPARIGVYEASISKANGVYRYWDGRRWSWLGGSPKEAFACRASPSSFTDIYWRGLAGEPA